VHTLAVLTFVLWWLVLGHTWQASLLNAITVLIITCPCALGLAVPVVQVLASGRLMKQGILLKSGNALEKLANIGWLVLDKTGTLTLGKPQWVESACDQEQLKYAASLAVHSKHPLSQAVEKRFSGSLYTAESVKEVPGKGLIGMIEGQQVRLGNRQWCGGVVQDQSGTLELWLAINDQKAQRLVFSDQLRADAKQVIAQFQQAGIQTLLLSGDRKEAVKEVADSVGIKKYQFGLSPVDKYHRLEALKNQGQFVLMVGDGINDAPSLAAAQVSMSPSSAMDITQNAADVVFQGKRLWPVYEAWNVARQANTLVKQNFILAVAYNVVAIPLAVSGQVTPLIAAMAMSASSLLVISNSFRLVFRR
jgi:Cu2+-exporting ATPase